MRAYTSTITKRITNFTIAAILAVATMTAMMPFILASSAHAAPNTSYNSTTGFSGLTWGADRSLPTGANEVSGNTLTIGVDGPSVNQSSQGFYRYEGLKAALPTGANTVKADLYVDPAWEGKQVLVGMWGQVDASAGAPNPAWPTLEFNTWDYGTATVDVWNTFDGTITSATSVAYGDTISLEIEVNNASGDIVYYLNGNEVWRSANSDGDGVYDTFSHIIFNNRNFGPAADTSYTTTWSNLQIGFPGVRNSTTGDYYYTIQAAIDAASDGATITVAPGTYNAFQIVGKTGINIVGSGVGQTIIEPTSLIASGVAHKYLSNTKTSVFVNNSTNVSLTGLTITGNGLTPGAGGADALVFWNSSTGAIINSAVTGNYTISGAQTGQGIAVDGVGTNLTVSNVAISGFQKNGIDIVTGNGATTGGGAVSVTVNGGTVTGAGATSVIAQNGIMVWNRGQGSGVELTVNSATIQNLSYNTPEVAMATGILAYGPSVAEASNVTVNNVTFLNTQLGFENQTTVPSSVVLPDEAPLATGTPTDTGDGTVTTTVNNNVEVIGASGSTVEIVAGTTVTAADDSGWDGIINAPTIVTNPAELPAGATVGVAIHVGSNVPLTFSNAVRLLLPGQAGKLVGFTYSDGVLHTIPTICTADSQVAGDSLVAGGDCAITVGNDLVVWTKHFTTFVSYTPATPAITPPSTTSTPATTTSTPTTEQATVTDDAAVLGTQSDDKKSPAETVAAAQNGFVLAWYWWLLIAAAAAGLASAIFVGVRRRAQK